MNFALLLCLFLFVIAADAKVQRQEMVPVLTAEQRKEAAPLHCRKLDAGTFTLQ